MAMNFGTLTFLLSSLALVEATSSIDEQGFHHESAEEPSSAATGWLPGLAPDYHVEVDSPRTTVLPEVIGTLPSYPEASTRPAATLDDIGPEFDKVGEEPGHRQEAQGTSSRNKRTLTFPNPSTILLIFGLGTPLQLDRESIILGAFTKMVYNLPVNSTDFTEPGVYFARTKTRWSIYKVLERAAELYGYPGGKECLLRAICEVAAAPFDLRQGLFGHMVQTFLTPSSTSEPYDEYGDQEYHAAERLGRHADENCRTLYPECERSFLDVFSTTGNNRTVSSSGSLTSHPIPQSLLTNYLSKESRFLLDSNASQYQEHFTPVYLTPYPATFRPFSNHFEITFFVMSRDPSYWLFFIALSSISVADRAVLLFPQNTVFQFTIGVTVPVAMDKTGGIAFSAGFQFNYVLPWNLSQFDPVIVPSREIGNINLQDVYSAVESLLLKHDWQRSRECLLRTICELAETPLNRHEHTSPDKRDVIQEIIHLLLTPSEDLPEAVNSSHRSVNKLYQEAERLGRSGGDCILTYPDCIESPLESFTEIAFP
ncbi:uncharacterized protein [Venturia canescens]|uniref:uncharacterized protein n=1 Tax=Venturia canescens TaxID=32260 RepID=UPI001C9C3DF0|nr:uncharacterized protein LOC122418390 [Venturia canescens]